MERATPGSRSRQWLEEYRSQTVFDLVIAKHMKLLCSSYRVGSVVVILIEMRTTLCLMTMILRWMDRPKEKVKVIIETGWESMNELE